MSAAGKLDTKAVGGPSVNLWSEPFTARRAVYGFVERQNLPGIFRTFDFASPDSTSAKRFQTTVPQQALFFMNSPFIVEQAQALASRPEVQTAKDDAQRVRRLYLLLFQRLPDESEAVVGQAFLRRGAVEEAQAVWQYGYGPYNGTAARTGVFTPLQVFKDQGYRVGDAFPDPQLGYITLRAQGGHPGRDGNHAVIRRWVSPISGSITIEGLLGHGQAQGDGVRARAVSSRMGLLGEWRAHNSRMQTNVAAFPIQKGDTIDFIVDPIDNDAYDSFNWAPTIRSTDGKASWDAQSGFEGPPMAPPSRLALYAQALMMTNEFMFVD
jgi:hypothetical protein